MTSNETWRPTVFECHNIIDVKMQDLRGFSWGIIEFRSLHNGRRLLVLLPAAKLLLGPGPLPALQTPQSTVFLEYSFVYPGPIAVILKRFIKTFKQKRQ